jgi:hypothetical protein
LNSDWILSCTKRATLGRLALPHCYELAHLARDPTVQLIEPILAISAIHDRRRLTPAPVKQDLAGTDSICGSCTLILHDHQQNPQQLIRAATKKLPDGRRNPFWPTTRVSGSARHKPS